MSVKQNTLKGEFSLKYLLEVACYYFMSNLNYQIFLYN